LSSIRRFKRGVSHNGNSVTTPSDFTYDVFLSHNSQDKPRVLQSLRSGCGTPACGYGSMSESSGRATTSTWPSNTAWRRPGGRMLMDGLDAASAELEIGYESAASAEPRSRGKCCGECLTLARGRHPGEVMVPLILLGHTQSED
jgi:hypothetical protein